MVTPLPARVAIKFHPHTLIEPVNRRYQNVNQSLRLVRQLLLLPECRRHRLRGSEIFLSVCVVAFYLPVSS